MTKISVTRLTHDAVNVLSDFQAASDRMMENIHFLQEYGSPIISFAIKTEH